MQTFLCKASHIAKMQLYYRNHIIMYLNTCLPTAQYVLYVRMYTQLYVHSYYTQTHTHVYVHTHTHSRILTHTQIYVYIHV